MSSATSTLSSDIRVISWVSVAHGLSHFFQLALPPLFPYVKETFEVSYAALGLIVTVYYVISGLMQTAAGYAVDRFGPRAMLIFGLVCATAGTLIAATATSFPVLFIAAAIGGIGNAVFHPADLALINGKVNAKHLGYAFSLHQVGGSIGYVIAPLFVVAIAEFHGWRFALLAAGAIGVVFTAICAMQAALSTPVLPRTPAASTAGTIGEGRLLTSRPVLMGFAFFTVQAIALVGFMTFSPTAFAALYSTPLVFAATLLTAFLVGGIAGTLLGGWLVSRTDRHTLLAVLALGIAAVLSALIATGGLALGFLWAVSFGVGVFIGVTNPSRDLLVREMAPPEHRGKVYGFVYSGLDAGSGLSGPIFGWLIDRGWPAGAFALAALCLLLTIPLVFGMRVRKSG